MTAAAFAGAYAIRNQATAAQPGYLQGLGRSFTTGLSYQF